MTTICHLAQYISLFPSTLVSFLLATSIMSIVPTPNSPIMPATEPAAKEPEQREDVSTEDGKKIPTENSTNLGTWSRDKRLQMFARNLRGRVGFVTTYELAVEAKRLDIRDVAVLALCAVLFDDKILIQIERHQHWFIHFTRGSPKAQKHLLRGVEHTIGRYPEALVPKVCHILKALSESTILDEDMILWWDSKKDAKTVGEELTEKIHASAAPFLKHLVDHPFKLGGEYHRYEHEGDIIEPTETTAEKSWFVAAMQGQWGLMASRYGY